jgi:hypothetical protein
MKRQMFKAGGAAFPDLSGDGKVTQKDILMGRGVQFMERGTEVMDNSEFARRMKERLSQGFARGTEAMDNQEFARRMKERLFQDYMRRENEEFEKEYGLDRLPTMEQRERSELIREQQMTPEQKNYIRREQMRQLQNYPERMQEGGMVEPMMDPAMMQAPMDPAQNEMMGGIAPLLEQVAQVTDDLDTARNYEELINMLRGDQMPIGARYEELASLVGPDDAVQTPESVLALTQPTIMMTMGAGIGGLAQEAMDVPVEGDMAGGIMQMAAPPPQLPPPPMDPMMDPGMEAGGTPPVNFNQGGLVRRGDNQPVQKFNLGGVPEFLPNSPAMIDPSMDPFGLKRQELQETQFRQAEGRNVGQVEGFGVGRQLGQREGVLAGQQAALDAAPDLKTEFEDRRDLYREILGSDEQTRTANRGQFFLDLAKAGLSFAGARGDLTIGEKIAKAAEDSKIVENIQARSAAEKARKEKLDVAALTGAEQRVEAQLQSQAEMRRLLAKQKFDEEQKELDRKTQLEEAEIQATGKRQDFKNYEVTGEGVTINGKTVDIGESVTLSADQANDILKLNPGALQVRSVADATASLDTYLDQYGNFENVVRKGDKFFLDGKEVDYKYMSGLSKISAEKVPETRAQMEQQKRAERAYLKSFFELYPTLELDQVYTEKLNTLAFDNEGTVPSKLNPGEDIMLDSWLIEGDTIEEFQKYAEQKAGQAYDLELAIQQGTGLSNAIQANVGEFLQSLGFDADWADDKIQARHVLSMVTLLLRAGFAKNPRLAIAEWERIGTITPEIDKYLTSPKAFLNQLNTLNGELKLLRNDILGQILEETRGQNDPARLRQLNAAAYTLVQPIRLLSSLDRNQGLQKNTSPTLQRMRDAYTEGGNS